MGWPARMMSTWRMRAAFAFPGRAAPAYEVAGRGRRALAWQPGNPGVNAAFFASGAALRTRSRDLARRNPWAANALEAFVANCIGTGIKPQSMAEDAGFRAAVHALWWEWSEEADAAGLTDFQGLQALACRAMLEGGECFVRLRPRRAEDGLAVPLQLQLLEAEHVPLSLNTVTPDGNAIRAGIEFDLLGRRVAYHVTREHPGDPPLRPGGTRTVRVPAGEMVHLFRPLRPGQIRGKPWLARALVKLNELDQYDDAELVRKKTAAMFAGFITRLAPEDPIMGEGEGEPDADGAALAGLEPGTMQVLAPGEDVKFSDPADVGSAYGEFLRTQFRAVAVAAGITYEQLTGDLSGVNYSSIRAGLLEFRRRCEMIQHGVIVHQLCRPVWRAWMIQAVLAGALTAPGFGERPGPWLKVKWIAQGWQWVDPEKEFKAMVLAIRAGLMSRADDLGLVQRPAQGRAHRRGAAGPAGDADAGSTRQEKRMRRMPHIAARVLGTPLVIGQAKLEAILSVLGPRIGVEVKALAAPPGPARPRGTEVTHEGIAMILVFGTLVKRAGAIEAASGLAGIGDLETAILDAATDPAVRAILLDVDSPGGEAAGVFDLADLVFEARGLKLVWAVANEEAFSGAYAVASAAERLIVRAPAGSARLASSPWGMAATTRSPRGARP